MQACAVRTGWWTSATMTYGRPSFLRGEQAGRAAAPTGVPLSLCPSAFLLARAPMMSCTSIGALRVYHAVAMAAIGVALPQRSSHPWQPPRGRGPQHIVPAPCPCPATQQGRVERGGDPADALPADMEGQGGGRGCGGEPPNEPIVCSGALPGWAAELGRGALYRQHARMPGVRRTC